MEGRIKWFNHMKGFGFIEQENGPDVFVHHSEIDSIGFQTPIGGEKVTFDIKETHKGQNAVNVCFK